MHIIRFVRDKDIEEISKIEDASYPKPWPQNAFKCELSKFKSGICIFAVAADADTDEILGYIMGDKIADFIHISNIAVTPSARKLGIGRALLTKLETEAHKCGFNAFTLEVRATNEAALAMYKRFGYEEKGRRGKYYENTDDAIIMWKKN